MLRKQKTEKKYSDFIRECADKGTFSIKAMIAKHKVDAAIVTTMRQEECITSVTADLSNWIETKPNEVMINRIIESHRQRITMYRLNRLKKVKEKQITTPNLEWYTPPPEPITEQSAVAFLKSLGGYEIFKVERKQL